MHEPFGRGKERFVHGKTNDNDNEDHADDLVHGVELTAIV